MQGRGKLWKCFGWWGMLLCVCGGQAAELPSSLLQRSQGEMEQVLLAGGPATGWRLKAQPRFYAGDEVYAYLDGAAEVPKACGFRLLGVAEYTYLTGVGVKVELYDLGTSANAFGLYSLKRDPSHRFLKFTHWASLTPGELIFWKDHYTAVLFTEAPKRLPEDALVALGRTLEGKISRPGNLPDLLRYLPPAGYVKHSAKYFHGKFALDALWFHPRNLFLLDQRSEAVFAVYQKPSSRLLLLRYPSVQTPVQVVEAWRQTFEGMRRLSLPPPFGGFLARQGEKNLGICRAQNLVGVVLEAPRATDVERRLRELVQAMQKPSPPWGRGAD
ncbi:MAG TPA: hypothetical protein EYP85_03100 [Armatimonadetes bacterium]|nr:hypothetical protein [Armatimonadota bacterium]